MWSLCCDNSTMFYRRSGELFEGDNVLAIDNRSIDNLHISEIKPLLRELRSEYTLKIQYEVKKPGKAFVAKLQEAQAVS